MAYMHVYNVIALDGWEVWALCLDWCLFPSIYPSSHPTIHLTQHGYPSNSAVCFIYTHYQRLFINFRVCVPVNALCVCVVSRMPPIRPESTVEIEFIADTKAGWKSMWVKLISPIAAEWWDCYCYSCFVSVVCFSFASTFNACCHARITLSHTFSASGCI